LSAEAAVAAIGTGRTAVGVLEVAALSAADLVGQRFGLAAAAHRALETRATVGKTVLVP
jgi:hypothetical protein